ncbi:MAG: hypothetical protein AAF738_00030 [Bacteroidota bacterium]
MKESALTDLISQDFQLETHSHANFSADELLQWVADQVAYLLEFRTEFLMSLFYRLDIDEAKVNAALSPIHTTPTNVALAQLIIERQQERLFTKKFYKQYPLDNIDEDLKW